jgi:hypothetical protein
MVRIRLSEIADRSPQVSSTTPSPAASANAKPHIHQPSAPEVVLQKRLMLAGIARVDTLGHCLITYRRETSMRTLRIVLPNGSAFNVTQNFLIEVFAVVAAIWLMFAYVQLLHESVARGEQIRAKQRATVRQVGNLGAAGSTSMKPGRLYVEFAQARNPS